MGGINDEDSIELNVNVYDPAKNAWTTCAPLPGPKQNGFSAGSCSAGGHLYASVGDGKVVRLSADGKAWQEVGKLKQPRIVHRMVAANDALLVLLGGAGRGWQRCLDRDAETVDPRPKSRLPLTRDNRVNDRSVDFSPRVFPEHWQVGLRIHKLIALHRFAWTKVPRYKDLVLCMPQASIHKPGSSNCFHFFSRFLSCSACGRALPLKRVQFRGNEKVAGISLGLWSWKVQYRTFRLP